MLGIGVGTSAWAAAGFLGVRGLFAAAPWTCAALKVLGGGYLLFPSLRLLWNGKGDVGKSGPTPERLRSGMSSFPLGLVTNLANPKSALFVASVFATAMPDHSPLALGLVAMAVMAAISVAWCAAVACLFTTPPIAAAHRRGRRWVDRLAGGGVRAVRRQACRQQIAVVACGVGWHAAALPAPHAGRAPRCHAA